MPEIHDIHQVNRRNLPQEDGMSFLALVIFLLIVGGTVFAIYHHEIRRPDMNAALSPASPAADSAQSTAP